MIRLSNGHEFEFMVASGALAYDGKGWPWEWPLRWMGLLRPELFTVVTKTLTRFPRAGHLKWRKPWECVRLWNGDSAVNKVGLTNPGIRWWCDNVAWRLDRKIPIIVSIFGDHWQFNEMTHMLNDCRITGIEVNPSCPNTGHAQQTVDTVVKCVEETKHVSKHPVIVKVSVAQDYVEIARRLVGIADAVSLNSVPWEIVYPPNQTSIKSPLWRLEKRVGGGGGGVSGKLAQPYNWKAVEEISQQVPEMPVIGPSIMDFSDMIRVQERGAKAFSFGAIHLRTPWKPTRLVKQWTATEYEKKRTMYHAAGA